MSNYFEGKYLLLKHRKLTMIAVQGELSSKLSEASGFLKVKYPRAEIAPIQHQDLLLRDFLALYFDDPVRDITIDNRAGESAIVGFSFRENILAGTM